MGTFPFIETQLRELELQTLIFNHMASGIPVPSLLIAHFRRSFCLLDSFPLYPSMSMGRRAEDTEPWRCKRTDGKKWRCTREALQDSKYCERHIHRGKKRGSRKPVEFPSSSCRPDGCCDFLEEGEKLELQRPKHCFVLGADLMLKDPVRVEREQGGQDSKPLLRLFSERAEPEEDACSRTKLSISIPL